MARRASSPRGGGERGLSVARRVLVAGEPFARGSPATGIPAPGEAWPDSKLLAAVGGHVGSQLSIGAASLRVTRVLIARPDQGGTFAELAPEPHHERGGPARHAPDPARQPRELRRAVAGERTRIDAFKAWLITHKGPGERLRDITEASRRSATP